MCANCQWGTVWLKRFSMRNWNFKNREEMMSVCMKFGVECERFCFEASKLKSSCCMESWVGRWRFYRVYNIVRCSNATKELAQGISSMTSSVNCGYEGRRYKREKPNSATGNSLVMIWVGRIEQNYCISIRNDKTGTGLWASAWRISFP